MLKSIGYEHFHCLNYLEEIPELLQRQKVDLVLTTSLMPDVEEWLPAKNYKIVYIDESQIMKIHTHPLAQSSGH